MTAHPLAPPQEAPTRREDRAAVTDPTPRDPPEHRAFVLREAGPDDFARLGQLMASVYASLEGFPDPAEQPEYYDLLRNVGRLAATPDTRVLVAVVDGAVIGGVVYFSDMARYGSGGSAAQQKAASGFRFLAVDPGARRMGVGKALARMCMDLARQRNHRQVILHTTDAMEIAWRMYEHLGFEHSPDLDFLQGELPVYGFRLIL